MLRLYQENMFSIMGLWIEPEIHIINDSKKIIYVTIYDTQSNPPKALDPGRQGVLPLSKDTIRLTVSYYDKNHEMQYLCNKMLLNKGRLIRIKPSHTIPSNQSIHDEVFRVKEYYSFRSQQSICRLRVKKHREQYAPMYPSSMLT